MAATIKDELNHETMEMLQNLIRANLDSAQRYREAAEVIDHEELAAAFASMAEERDHFATELKSHVLRRGDSPVQDGSWIASLHQGWMSIRAKLNDGDPYVVVIEAERGERQIENAYENALQSTAGDRASDSLADALNRHSVAVKRGRDALVVIRDSLGIVAKNGPSR